MALRLAARDSRRMPTSPSAPQRSNAKEGGSRTRAESVVVIFVVLLSVMV